MLAERVTIVPVGIESLHGWTFADVHHVAYCMLLFILGMFGLVRIVCHYHCPRGAEVTPPFGSWHCPKNMATPEKAVLVELLRCQPMVGCSSMVSWDVHLFRMTQLTISPSIKQNVLQAFPKSLQLNEDFPSGSNHSWRMRGLPPAAQAQTTQDEEQRGDSEEC